VAGVEPGVEPGAETGVGIETEEVERVAASGKGTTKVVRRSAREVEQRAAEPGREVECG
jgi:hypothetical protein